MCRRLDRSRSWHRGKTWGMRRDLRKCCCKSLLYFFCNQCGHVLKQLVSLLLLCSLVCSTEQLGDFCQVLQPIYLSQNLETWVVAFENVFCCLSDLFNCVRLSHDVWHLFSHQVNVNKSEKLRVNAFHVWLLDFKPTNTVGGQQKIGKLSELSIK